MFVSLLKRGKLVTLPLNIITLLYIIYLAHMLKAYGCEVFAAISVAAHVCVRERET
jgi:hypothetical protein